jgi:hypothetical protein
MKENRDGVGCSPWIAEISRIHRRAWYGHGAGAGQRRLERAGNHVRDLFGCIQRVARLHLLDGLDQHCGRRFERQSSRQPHLDAAARDAGEVAAAKDMLSTDAADLGRAAVSVQLRLSDWMHRHDQHLFPEQRLCLLNAFFGYCGIHGDTPLIRCGCGRPSRQMDSCVDDRQCGRALRFRDWSESTLPTGSLTAAE